MDNIERRLARVRARDEVNELIEERAAGLAESEGSSVFKPLHDSVTYQKQRDDFRARARLGLNMPCCDQYGIGDHDSTEHGPWQ